MAGNNALLPASTLLEWQEASINFLERKSDYALLVYHVTPHFGFEHRAIIRLAILGSDYSEFSRIGDPSSIQIPALRLPGKVHHETLRECMQMSLDAFGHIPLRIWIQFAFNVDEGILRQFLDYHMKLGTQLRTKELEVGEDFLAEVQADHPFLWYSLEHIRSLYNDPVSVFKELLGGMTDPLVPLLYIKPGLRINENLVVLNRFKERFDELRENLRKDSGSLGAWEYFHESFLKAAAGSLEELKINWIATIHS